MSQCIASGEDPQGDGNEKQRPIPQLFGDAQECDSTPPEVAPGGDLFTFVLEREGRRGHLVAFLDDHSRYMVGYGLHASSSGALGREVFEAAIANYGAPDEVLTDNGSQ